MKATLISTLALCIGTLIGQAQIHKDFGQELSTLTNMFPALAGWHGGLQINTMYRNQYPGIPSTNVDYSIGADGYSHKLRSGFSLNLGHNRHSTGIVNVNKVDFSWSPKIELENELVIMPSVSLGYFQIAIDYNQTSTSPSLP